MRILFLTSTTADYLADGVLHGLRTLHGADVVDYPKCEPLYQNCPRKSFDRVRGHGFTLYGLLEDLEIDRWDVETRLRRGDFDRIIFGNICRTYGLFVEWRKWLPPENTILLDGEDTQAIAPYAGQWWRRPSCWCWPSAHLSYRYYKREWGEDTLRNRCWKMLPVGISRRFHGCLRLRRINFSIPSEKIVLQPTKKTKDFASHIVDVEVASRLGNANSTAYNFTRESDYYDDIRSARYGITTQRAGWDCLRHYEIAANGAVPCFRKLNEKPATCAPHGLDSHNCVIYDNAEDLIRQVAQIDTARYTLLQTEALKWVRKNSTVNIAKTLLSQ
jgi:hypothetical protein